MERRRLRCLLLVLLVLGLGLGLLGLELPGRLGRLLGVPLRLGIILRRRRRLLLDLPWWRWQGQH
jgi:hypothetical protein